MDAAAPDNTVFFSIYTSNADSIAGVQQESLAILTRNGMKIARQRAPERSLSFAGLDWTENQYSATEDGKPKRITLDAVHLSGKKFVQLLMWGSPKGMEMNSASLKKIFNTIKLKNG